MIGTQPCERDPLHRWNATKPPCVKRLGGKPEVLTHLLLSDAVDQRAMSVFMSGHDPLINTALTEDNSQSLIELNACEPFTVHMGDLAKIISGNLRKRMDALGLKPADLARKMGWSAQRINNYVHKEKPRAPDIAALVSLAKCLGTTPDRLLGISEAPPFEAYTVILRLLELAGLPRERAEVIASVAQEALGVLAALPDEGDARTRALLAAQAAWQMTQISKPS